MHLVYWVSFIQPHDVFGGKEQEKGSLELKLGKGNYTQSSHEEWDQQMTTGVITNF